MGLTHWDGPGMGGRKDIMSCLALGTRQETQSDSFVKGHTMPGHPPSPVGKRQPAASFPGESHSSSKAEVGAHPSWNLKEIPRACPKTVHEGAAVSWPKHRRQPLPRATFLL